MQAQAPRLVAVQIAPAEGNELAKASIFVEARGDIWELFVLEEQDPETYMVLTNGAMNDEVLHDYWMDKEGWFRVEAEPCSTCGKRQALCALCDETARHFLDEKDGRNARAYLCDNHGEVFTHAFEEGEYESEIGAYCVTSECICDSWQ